VRFEPAPTSIDARAARYRVELDKGITVRLEMAAQCNAQAGADVLSFDEALARARAELDAHLGDDCAVTTSNDLFDAWIGRAQADLRMMVTETEMGRYPYAGVPWFSTPFGRDGILTALEALWMNPTLAAGVLDYLAARQARDRNDRSDAEPGKILHETRGGEMAALGEVPFGKYYGSIDSTPLFALLAARYHCATGDDARIERLWPALEAALGWIDRDGDRDGDGFVEYSRDGRTRTTPCSTPTEATPWAPSLSARCRATSTPPSASAPGSPTASASRSSPRA
jgi:glycogen debranching enzyme